MRDCVVVGCGRSGTSLAAGLLAGSGYDSGADLLPPDEGGPTGFYEARRVNDLNEALLAAYDESFACRDGYSRPLRDGERWLAVLPDGVEVEPRPELVGAMARAVPSSPYVCKDPRFGYTLAGWLPVLEDALFVCVFRDPLETATSIARDVRYGDLTVTVDAAVELWRAIYRRVLERHRGHGDWLFLHYRQLLDGSGVRRLAEATGTALDAELADPSLNRARAIGPPPASTAPLYDELCAGAGFAR